MIIMRIFMWFFGIVKIKIPKSSASFVFEFMSKNGISFFGHKRLKNGDLTFSSVVQLFSC